MRQAFRGWGQHLIGGVSQKQGQKAKFAKVDGIGALNRGMRRGLSQG